MTHTLTAISLDDIADTFEKFAEGCDVKVEDAIGANRRVVYRTEARVWREAADVLRHTKLQPPQEV